jgi:phosphoribosylanthranilate isomerase
MVVGPNISCAFQLLILLGLIFANDSKRKTEIQVFEIFLSASHKELTALSQQGITIDRVLLFFFCG